MSTSHNGLLLNTQQVDDDDKSTLSINTSMVDEVDIALMKCMEENNCLKSLQVSKLKKGLYKFESKEYQLKILQGNNLAIKMHGGYIFTDCLSYFDEELIYIVKGGS